MAIPAFRRGRLLLTVPFSHIRGELTGGLLKHLTSLAWGPIRDFLQGQIDRLLSEAGLPYDLVSIEQRRDDDGQQLAVIEVSMQRLNGWLAARKWLTPRAVQIEGLKFTDQDVTVDLTLVEQLAPRLR